MARHMVEFAVAIGLIGGSLANFLTWQALDRSGAAVAKRTVMGALIGAAVGVGGYFFLQHSR